MSHYSYPVFRSNSTMIDWFNQLFYGRFQCVIFHLLYISLFGVNKSLHPDRC